MQIANKDIGIESNAESRTHTGVGDAEHSDDRNLSGLEVPERRVEVIEPDGRFGQVVVNVDYAETKGGSVSGRGSGPLVEVSGVERDRCHHWPDIVRTIGIEILSAWSKQYMCLV